MSAEKVIYELLTNDANLNAVVPTSRVFAGLIPLNTTLPAIAYNHISTTEQTAVGLTTITNRSRIQVTVAEKDYVAQKNIINLIKSACNNKRGTFNGVVTDSVILDIAGSDFRDDEADIYYQTIDFRIVYKV